MPTPAEGLTPESSMESVKTAISETVAHYVSKGREQEQAVAIAYSQARHSTGKMLSHLNPDEPIELPEDVKRQFEEIRAQEALWAAVREEHEAEETPEQEAAEQETETDVETSAGSDGALLARIAEIESKIDQLVATDTAVHESAQAEGEVAEAVVEPEPTIVPHRRHAMLSLPRWLW